MFTLFVKIYYIFLKPKGERWLIGSFTGAVVFNIVAKYIHLISNNFINKVSY